MAIEDILISLPSLWNRMILWHLDGCDLSSHSKAGSDGSFSRGVNHFGLVVLSPILHQHLHVASIWSTARTSVADGKSHNLTDVGVFQGWLTLLHTFVRGSASRGEEEGEVPRGRLLWPFALSCSILGCTVQVSS